MEDAPFTFKVRLLKTEVMETLLYGCMTLALGLERFAKLRTAHHNLLLRIIGVQRRQRTKDRMSYAKALKNRHSARALRPLSANDASSLRREPYNGRPTSD